MHNSILEGKRRNETGKTEGEEKGKRGRRGGKGAREMREGMGGSRRKGKRGRERMGRDRKEMNTQTADSTQVATTYTCLMITLRFDTIIGTQAVTQVPNLND